MRGECVVSALFIIIEMPMMTGAVPSFIVLHNPRQRKRLRRAKIGVAHKVVDSLAE